jgi:hypothetical protein
MAILRPLPGTPLFPELFERGIDKDIPSGEHNGSAAYS